ncbi:hypothetical protein ACLOJK_012449 [Asimina triloba]
MVLVLVGRTITNPTNDESGVVSKEEVDSFDVPYYTPSVEGFGDTVEKEGSFNIEQLETFGLELAKSVLEKCWVRVSESLRSH